ncbi:MAG TPA: FHA domain-containing protein, partial [Polyangia bacterium]|nr:FHA domain-containing protein [Polyangia bacterium]
MAEQTETPFALLVSLVGGKPARYQFNQDRLLVGRGLESDLRVEHAAFSRSQFLIERGRGSAGEARYRITPYETTNPTHVNERPAVEGTLTPGD